MWSAKKKTIRVFFVLTEGRADIENMSDAMQLAFQVSDNALLHCTNAYSPNHNLSICIYRVTGLCES